MTNEITTMTFTQTTAPAEDNVHIVPSVQTVVSIVVKSGSHSIIRICFGLLLLLFLQTGCTPEQPRDRITLKWHKAYPGETWGKVKTGMLWSLSFLGAALPPGSADSCIKRTDSTTIELHLGGLGFNPEALEAMQTICDSIKRTESYSVNGNVDLSRFLVLTLHSSWHYYRITGVAPDLNTFLKTYDLSKAEDFGITNSCVASHHRVIRMNEPGNILKTAFVAVEGDGSLLDSSFVAEAYEVIDFMPNGQLRFAVYDRDAKLLAGSPAKFGKAGKPSKCLWCHEIVISPLFFENPEVPGMLSNKDFEVKRKNAQTQLEEYRKTLKSEIDFKRTQDHTLSELLYIGFMEPSLLRLSSERNEDSLSVQKQFSFLQPHIYEEFPFLGSLYYRSYADSMAKPRPPAVPFSVREPLDGEPDFFKK